MPFFGYGCDFGCSDPICPNQNPHCHWEDHHGPCSSPPPFTSTSPSSSLHTAYSTARQPIKPEDAQPSLAAGCRVDLSKIPGFKYTGSGTFSFGGETAKTAATNDLTARAGNMELNRLGDALERRGADHNLRDIARWTLMEIGEPLQRSSTNCEPTKVARDETAAVVTTPTPSRRRSSAAAKRPAMPPIAEHTASSVHEKGGVTDENTTTAETTNEPTADVEQSGVVGMNTPVDIAEYPADFKPPSRVFTGDSAFDGDENERTSFRPPARVLTGDSAFYSGESGENSRSRSRKSDESPGGKSSENSRSQSLASDGTSNVESG